MLNEGHVDMDSEVNEEAALGCCGGPPVDSEMKNAVAIQRNAAAIAAVIKTLQKLQSQIDQIWAYIHGEESSSV